MKSHKLYYGVFCQIDIYNAEDIISCRSHRHKKNSVSHKPDAIERYLMKLIQNALGKCCLYILNYNYIMLKSQHIRHLHRLRIYIENFFLRIFCNKGLVGSFVKKK